MESLFFFQETFFAALFAGIGCSLAGVFLFCLRIPFVGVLIAHAAMTGAIAAAFFGWPILPMAFAAALLAVFLAGPLADTVDVDLNISLSLLFSLAMGLAFLGIGLMPEPKTSVLTLLWGNILLADGTDAMLTGMAALAAVGLVAVGYKEIQVVLFSRTIANAVGLRGGLVFYSLLAVSGAVVSVNLNSIGGLMLYSLLINPAAGAYQIATRLKPMMALAVGLGVTSSLLGLAASFFWALPTGASIVIVSSLAFAVCALMSPKRRRYRRDMT